MLAAYQRAIHKPIVVEFHIRADAYTFRRRMYELRRALVHEAHPVAEIAKRVVLRMPEFDGDIYKVLIEARDANFETTLEQAGVTPTEAPQFDIPDAPDFPPELPERRKSDADS